MKVVQKLLALGAPILYFLAQIYWFIFRPHTEGVRIIIRSGNKILFMRQGYVHTNNWVFPGGGVKRGESPEDAIRREVKEEVGITLSDIHKIGVIERDAEYKKDTIYCFETEVSSLDIRIDPVEAQEASWFDVDNLPENIGSVSKQMLRIHSEK